MRLAIPECLIGLVLGTATVSCAPSVKLSHFARSSLAWMRSLPTECELEQSLFGTLHCVVIDLHASSFLLSVDAELQPAWNDSIGTLRRSFSNVS